MPIELIVTSPLAPWPVGTIVRGHLGPEVATVVDPSRRAGCRQVPVAWVAVPPGMSQSVSEAVRRTLLLVAGGLSGCLRDPSAAYAAGLMDGAALVVGAVTVVWVCLSWARAVAASRAELQRMEARRDTAYAGRACLARSVGESCS